MFAPDRDWGVPVGARVLFTTRLGGAGVAPFDSLNLSLRTGDSEEAVLENRRRVGERLPSSPKWLRQVHGTRVVCADDASPDEEADAAFTFSRGVVCAVMTADCLPVVLCAKKGGAGGAGGAGEWGGAGVAAAHAGWRGLAGGILERTYSALRTKTDGEIVARIGPGISAGCYPVGDDVRRALSRGAEDDAYFAPAGGGKFLADLKGLARRRLLDLGAARVVVDADCTFSDSSRYFSARRDGATGRMAALIWRE